MKPLTPAPHREVGRKSHIEQAVPVTAVVQLRVASKVTLPHTHTPSPITAGPIASIPIKVGIESPTTWLSEDASSNNLPYTICTLCIYHPYNLITHQLYFLDTHNCNSLPFSLCKRKKWCQDAYVAVCVGEKETEKRLENISKDQCLVKVPIWGGSLKRKLRKKINNICCTY